MASCQPRSREPAPAQSDERHRELPHGGPRRTLSRAARTAPTRRSPTTAAATGTARSARARQRASGWRRARPNCSRSLLPRRLHAAVAIGDIAYQNKAVIYDLLFKASSETMLRIAADPKHLGARIGITSVLHTWGSAMTHHPHVHMIVPGGGLSMDGSRWISCKPDFFLPVRVLSKLFRRLMLEKLLAAHGAGRLQFLGSHAHLADAKTFAAFLAPLRKKRWFVSAKRPFAGPKAVLAYLSRYTHRVAISNRRLIAVDRAERHIQGQGLQDRRPRPVHDDDGRCRRVHPPDPHPRPAQRRDKNDLQVCQTIHPMLFVLSSAWFNAENWIYFSARCMRLVTRNREAADFRRRWAPGLVRGGSGRDMHGASRPSGSIGRAAVRRRPAEGRPS